MPAASLLGPDDPPPFTVLRADAAAPFVFTCDHAGRAIPAGLNRLGLGPAELDRHIAWDIGAADLTRRLSEAFGACAILQTYSRLVVDCNRDADADDSMPAVADGSIVPGNRELSTQARAERLDAIHAPYHAAIAAALQARMGGQPIVVFVHSFTPRMNGLDRPWLYGVLHDGASVFSRRVLEALRDAHAGACGDNEPYAFGGTDYSALRHALARGLDYLELEVRQDLVSDPRGVADTAAFLAGVLRGALR